METEIAQLQADRANGETTKADEGDRVGLGSTALDKDLYGSDMSNFTTEIQDAVDDDEGPGGQGNHPATRASINADRKLLDQGTDADTGEDPFAAYRDAVRSIEWGRGERKPVHTLCELPKRLQDSATP